MPEPHNFGPGLYGYVQFISLTYSSSYWAYTTFNLVLVFFPPHHKLIMTTMKMHKMIMHISKETRDKILAAVTSKQFGEKEKTQHFQ